jgi:hypothetical protein
MCPDGSYVGRTGPNCEFTACPNTPTTPTPVTSSCPNIYTTIRYGQKNTQVVELQKYLFTKYNVQTQTTGYFGMITRSHVIQFQKDNGLQADGIVGMQTRSKIQTLCSQMVKTPADSCKIWFDGCNTCSRTTPGGTMACTMMACIWANEQAAECRASF